MNMIVTADDNWAIGHKGRPLVNIPADERFFREETRGKVVVMGRRTLERLPQGRPWPDRDTIILSTQPSCRVRGARTVSSLEALLRELSGYPSGDIYVTGGAAVFRQLLPYCDLVHVTRLHHRYQADAWFPNLDELPEWVITGDSEEQTYFDLEYHFLRYERLK